jgi:hypothetical protein
VAGFQLRNALHCMACNSVQSAPKCIIQLLYLTDTTLHCSSIVVWSCLANWVSADAGGGLTKCIWLQHLRIHAAYAILAMILHPSKGLWSLGLRVVWVVYSHSLTCTACVFGRGWCPALRHTCNLQRHVFSNRRACLPKASCCACLVYGMCDCIERTPGMQSKNASQQLTIF